MTTNSYLSNRLREVLLDGRWIANTNFKEQITNTTWQEATCKIGSLNTIAALTFHINYYVAGLLNVFENGRLEIRDQFSFDLPPIRSESDWKNLVREFITNAEQFSAQVEKMPEDQFTAAFADEKYGNYQRNIDGVIEHTYYHLGQVSLIRKLISEQTKDW
jgi:hypothetical protein